MVLFTLPQIELLGQGKELRTMIQTLPWTDDTKDCRREQDPVVPAQGKYDAAGGHRNCAKGEHPPSAEPVGSESQ